MAPNYYQLIEIAPKLREVFFTETMCEPEEVCVEFKTNKDDLQKLNHFFYEKIQNKPAPEDLVEIKEMNVRLCGIKFTYKSAEEKMNHEEK